MAKFLVIKCIEGIIVIFLALKLAFLSLKLSFAMFQKPFYENYFRLQIVCFIFYYNKWN